MSAHPFDRWPDLRLPRRPLGRWPTPVRPVQIEDFGTLWVKDESRCAPRCGGNKIRKLELLLGDALQGRAPDGSPRTARDLLTLGAVGSHHVLATALHAADAGLRTHAVLFPQPATPHAREVAERIVAACASVTLATSLKAVPAAWSRAWLRIVKETGHRPIPIPAGGSSALGTAGWIAGGLELADDIAAGRLPEPRRVVAALGSGGMVAGLWVGLRLAGVQAEVVGVRVVTRAVANQARVRHLATSALALLQANGAPQTPIRLKGLRIARGWLGAGYGTADPRVTEAMVRASRVGLHLEQTYTGRACAACLADAPGPVVFVQSLGVVDPDVPRAALSPEVEALLR